MQRRRRTLRSNSSLVGCITLREPWKLQDTGADLPHITMQEDQQDCPAKRPVEEAQSGHLYKTEQTAMGDCDESV
jgi:hypothetical protein